MLQEPDRYMQFCGVIVNIFDQFYYPAEHIAWAADKGLLSCRSDKWWLASTICWVLSLYFNLARYIYVNFIGCFFTNIHGIKN